jgi:hypothetical protein
VDQAKYGVHKTHCCATHGCKYSAPDCPVFTKVIQGDPGVCEYCTEDEAEFKAGFHDLARRITASQDTFVDFLSGLLPYTKDPKILMAITAACRELK